MIKKLQDAGITNLLDASAFIEYSNAIDDAYSNTDHYNPKRNRKNLILFDDMPWLKNYLLDAEN